MARDGAENATPTTPVSTADQANASALVEGVSVIRQALAANSSDLMTKISEIATATNLARLAYNVKSFGAVGDNVTDDTSSIQSACNACQAAGGGIVYMPPTGTAYLVSNTITLGNGVVLMGSASKLYPGETGTVAQWTASGTWVRSTNTTNPTTLLSGHGCGLRGINFIRSQVIPGGGAYTPTAFPYEMKVTATFFSLSDILTVATTNDVWLAYSSGSGGGSYSTISNMFLGALTIVMKFDNVNDTMYLSNIRIRGLFYESTASLVTYRLTHTIGWDCGYFDNPQVDGIEFFHCYKSINFTDQTCLGATHSLYNASFSNASFNLVCYAMTLTTGTATVRASFADLLAQSEDTQTAQLFLITSDNISLDIGTFSVPFCGSRCLEIGNGSGGRVAIADCNVLNYGAVDTTASCMLVNAGGKLRLGTWNIETAASSGAKLAGAGINNTWTQTNGFATQTLTDASTVAWNAQTQQVAKVTLGGNRTLGAPSNLVDGFTYILRVIQDGTGSRTLAYNAVYKWPGGIAPVLSTAAGAIDLLTFVTDGTNMYGVIQKAFA